MSFVYTRSIQKPYTYRYKLYTIYSILHSMCTVQIKYCLFSAVCNAVFLRFARSARIVLMRSVQLRRTRVLRTVICTYSYTLLAAGPSYIHAAISHIVYMSQPLSAAQEEERGSDVRETKKRTKAAWKKSSSRENKIALVFNRYIVVYERCMAARRSDAKRYLTAEHRRWIFWVKN